MRHTQIQDESEKQLWNGEKDFSINAVVEFEAMIKQIWYGKTYILNVSTKNPALVDFRFVNLFNEIEVKRTLVLRHGIGE